MEPTPLRQPDDGQEPAPQPGETLTVTRPSDKAHEVAAYVGNLFDHFSLRYGNTQVAFALTELALKYIPA